MQRESSKHGPRLDEQMQEEDQNITRASHQPAHTEEWRQPEPFDEDHLTEPEDRTPGAPVGMTQEDVDQRSDLAVYLSPGKLPADRDAILDYAGQQGAPDDVLDSLRRLPAGQEFATIGEVVRALGVPTEEPRDRPES